MSGPSEEKYNELAIKLAEDLNAAGTYFTFSVDDYDTTQALGAAQLAEVDILAYKEYTGDDFDAEGWNEWVSNHFTVRWWIRVNGQKLSARQFHSCDLLGDTAIEFIVKDAADTMKWAVLGKL